MMSEQHSSTSFEAEWLEYRRRRRIFWIVFFSYLPVAMVFSILGRVFGWWNNGQDVGFIFFVWGPLFLLAGGREGLWRCPRCKGRFFLTALWVNSCASECPHCHLPKWGGSSFAKNNPTGQDERLD